MTAKKEKDDLFNAEFEEEEGEILLPPTIQWRHGSGDKNHPEALAKGGWQLPTEDFGFALGDSAKIYECTHSGGVILPSYMFEKLHFAVIAKRPTQWTAKVGDQIVYLKSGDDFGKYGKIEGRLKFWALCKELNNEPVIVSVAKSVSEAFSGNKKKKPRIVGLFEQFRQMVRVKASRKAKRAKIYPEYFLWMPVETSERITFDEGGYATLPRLAITDFSIESIRKLYVGREVIDIVGMYLHQAEEWAEKYDVEEEPDDEEDETVDGVEVQRTANGQPQNELDTHFPRDKDGNPIEQPPPVLANENRQIEEV